MSLSPLIRCPLCRASLSEEPQGLACTQGHRFDRARQGYYHLLPVQRKRSKAPGDSPMMVQGRRAFLDGGYYDPISNALNNMLEGQLPTRDSQSSGLTLLDCGCGEGFYTTHLHQHLTAQGLVAKLIGVDISKAAVKAACQRDKAIDWLVASGSDLPIQDQGLDALLCLFSRLMPAEFARTLSPQGVLLVATTGPEHLIELRQQLYSEVKQLHFEPDQHLTPNFRRVARQALRFQFRLEGTENIAALLSMTPHQWRSRAEAQQALLALERLDLTADIQLSAYRPCSEPG